MAALGNGGWAMSRLRVPRSRGLTSGSVTLIRCTLLPLSGLDLEGREKFPLPGNDQQSGQRETYAPDVIHGAALDFIRKHHDSPFFCLVASTIPHAELLVPQDSLRDYDGRFPEKPYVGDHYASNPQPRATYAGMVTRFDRDIGRIISCLDELGLAENSLVLFTSDNGPITAGGADPEFFGNAGPLRGLKFSLYEGGIRVPMIARWKGHLEAGRTSSLVWGFDDLMSTMCEIAGVKTSPGVDGVSVLPDLLGRTSTPIRPYRYWEATGGAGLMQAVRADNWKAVRPQTAAPLELYDLATDLGESRNVAAQHPDIVAKMEQYITEAHVAPQP